MSDPIYQTPAEAEAAFYAAFQRADLEAMMNVWAEDDDIVCVHPMGERLRGRTEVAESWRRIFLNDLAMRFEVTQAWQVESAELSVHSVHEHIDHGERLREHAVVIATNVYRRTGRGWRLILHHASPRAAPRTGRDGSARRTVH